MRFDPLPDKRAARKPVGIVVAGGAGIQVWTDAGGEIAHTPAECRTLLDSHAGTVLYAISSFTAIRGATGPEGWRLFQWSRGGIVWMELDSTRIRSSRGIFDGLDPATAISTLLEIDRDAERHRVTMGSWSSMASQLWRGTLAEPVAFAGRRIGKSGLYGGRKGCLDWARGAEIPNAIEIDLTGAYPSAMWREPFPVRMMPARRRHIESEGISRARVRLPVQPWPVLPERLRSELIRWEGGREIVGWWSNRELRMVRDSGGTVEPLETWEGHRMIEPFAEWGSVVHMLRDLPGPRGRWWKGVSNSLWGTFAMSAAGGRIVTLDADGLPAASMPVDRRRPPPPSAAYVATLTGARVRERLTRDALGLGWSTQAIYVDTDGAIIAPGGEIPPGATDAALPGEWRVKRILPRVMIRGPQAWAWWDTDDRPHVVMAGMTGATLSDLNRRGGADLILGGRS